MDHADRAGANERTDATLLRLTRALDELAVTPAPDTAALGGAERVRRFSRATGTSPATAHRTPPRPTHGTAPGPSPTDSDVLDQRELALLDARLDDLASHLRQVANDGGVARSALETLTRAVEDHLQRLAQTRAALDGLAGVVERQRANAAQIDGRLAAAEAQLARVQADGQDVVATLRAELAATAARTEELAGVVQRQAGQLTRLRAQVKALTPVEKAAVTRAAGPAAGQPASKRAAPKQTGARQKGTARTAR